MLKDNILYELEKNKDKSISGQSLADKFNVSRNAVWKAVNSLKNEGFVIESVKNLGYRISKEKDIISEAGIRVNLNDRLKNLPIKVYKTIDSTNNEAKRYLMNSCQDILIVSEEQTNGRGRAGKSFYSPSGTGIYMSLVYGVDFNIINNPMKITLKTAVACVRVLENLMHTKLQLKWVNDIYINNHKAAGILTEGIASLETGTIDNVVVGIGINISTEDFPDDIKNKATSLNCEINRNEIIGKIINELFIMYSDIDDTLFMDEYRERSIILGKKVSFIEDGLTLHAVAKGIADDGGLIIEMRDGEVKNIKNGVVEMDT